MLIGIVAAGGCGFGPGESEPGEANLRVTRDFGSELMVDATLTDPTESDSVVRFLDDNAEVETSYGGNFVDAINGVAGSTVQGGDDDWFFFVNGYYSEIGAGEARVHAGDRIWWDYRDWQQAYRVPAVVGSFPEPFLHGESGGEAPEVTLECVGGAGQGDACATVADALDHAGIDAEERDLDRPEASGDALRILVGEWSDLSDDPAAAQLEDGPSASGVYATVASCGDQGGDGGDGGYRLEVLGSDAKPRLQLADAGFVAAVRHREDPPTWVVAGTGPDSVQRAAALLGEDTLQDRYAVAAGPSGEPVPMPAPDELDIPEKESAPCG
ncbi:MAG: DUF4430 domain-containing protein [Solirubrobacterales bacterium]